MAKKPDFDIQTAHKYFSVKCFNEAWKYIDKPSLTKEEADLMLNLSMASLWHWSQRKDCTPTNLSIGYWQISRVFALLKQEDNARHYGELCLTISQKESLESFYLGYAYEALARAESVAGKGDKKDIFLVHAKQMAAAVPDKEDREHLLKDLETIK